MKTRLTELLNIEYPVIQASMAWITDAVLAAAVSEAGGLGTIGPNAGFKTVTSDVHETGERLREQIRKCKSLTDKPFAVNYVVGVPGWDREYSDRCIEVGIEEGAPVAVVSQGSPLVYTRRLKESGIRIIQVCSTVRHAVKSEEAGVDAVIVSGTEGGGHSGFDQLTTLCLVPQAVDAIELPVVAGGGIVDARGMMAALALGAEGVYMGTRFMATRECPAHDNVKQALLEATDTSTIALRHGSSVPARNDEAVDRGFVEERRGSVRLIYTDFLKRIMADSAGGVPAYEALAAGRDGEAKSDSYRTVAAFVEGKVQENTITASQASGLIRDVPTCAELIERLVRDASPIVERLEGMV
ncbi:MAG: nitronate monooxygenase [Proteobacteria bacterium]|nr:nitronate monooxygenase [Pseudomonadota bacterium]